MKCIDFIRAETPDGGRMILVAATISGIANAALLAIINTAAQQVGRGAAYVNLLLMFLIAIALYIYCLEYTFRKASEAFESALHRFRARIAAKLRDAELSVVESIGREVIYNQLIKEADVISQTQQILVGAMQASVMVAFIMLYIAWLSLPAFLITLTMTLVTSLIYYQRLKVTNTYIAESTRQELEVIKGITDLLDGFKQVRVRGALGEDLVQRIEEASDRLSDLKNQTTTRYNANNIFAQAFFYILIGAIVFILPRFIPTYPDVVHELTAAILFIIGPLGLVVTAIPSIDQANTAVSHIRALEAKLDKRIGPRPERTRTKPFDGFETLSLDRVRFTYPSAHGEPGFGIGPIDLEIRSGELIFVIGGNGSGKSTFLKVLTGLYQPGEGVVRVDGAAVNAANRQAYRELFAVIFGDFHLFQRLYGIDEVDPDDVEALLTDMEIDHKTSFDGVGFSNLDLSTGQRKRLAMVVARLEERPVFVFDEWAADQDPEFRKRFYTRLCPELVSQGRTVICVTHDDHYFHLADRILELRYGRIHTLEHPAAVLGGRP